ncbi:MAG: copper resistance D family protein, partial [Pyrinomonadaceae bacterium]
RAGAALVAGSAYAVLVALAAAAATLESRVLASALVLALPLVAVPTTTGHAHDRGLSRVNVAADILHVAGAATWVGALLGLVVTRRREVRLVIAGVALLAATGAVRAAYELLHVSQVWDSGYGRTLLVKTSLLLVAAAIGIWRRPRIELAIVGLLVVAVAVLVLQRPGRNNSQTPTARAAAPLSGSGKPAPAPPAPATDAIVVAREVGVYGVALASEPKRLTALVLAPDGGGADGVYVQIDGHDTTRCGHGCYRIDERHGDTTSVTVDGITRAFASPMPDHANRASLRSFITFFRKSRTVEYVERLAASPTNVLVSRWRLEAPNRVSYSIRGGGQAIVIGAHRWDRDSPRGRWVESAQTPLTQPSMPWRRATNVWQISVHDIVFFDPTIPAYFDLEFGEKPEALHMIAASHFMTDRYVSFGSKPRLRAPR